MDLADWFRARRWVAMLELIWQLPESSRLNEAQMNDPEYVEALLDATTDSGEQWSPRLKDYDLHALLLREIREQLVTVARTIVETTYVPGSDNKLRPLKASKVPALPAPRTELDRIKARRSRQAQMEIVRIFAPHAFID